MYSHYYSAPRWTRNFRFAPVDVSDWHASTKTIYDDTHANSSEEMTGQSFSKLRICQAYERCLLTTDVLFLLRAISHFVAHFARLHCSVAGPVKYKTILPF